MVNKFNSFLNKISKKGTVTLFAIAKMDEITDRWSVILAAPWINESSRDSVSKNLWSFLTKELDVGERAKIARAGIFNSNTPFIIKFNKYLVKSSGFITEEGKDIRLKNFNINGNTIHDAVIFKWTPLGEIGI